MKSERPSRGKFWKHPSGSAAGDWPAPVSIEGTPEIRWFYKSPLFPHGIQTDKLGEQSTELQQYVASWWFLQNYRQAVFPTPSYCGSSIIDTKAQESCVRQLCKASDVLACEFSSSSSDEVISTLSQYFPGIWERITSPTTLNGGDLRIQAVRRDVTLTGLDALSAQIEHLPDQYPDRRGIGGNGPPEPVDDSEPSLILVADKREAMLLISTVRQKITDGAPEDEVNARWEDLKPFLVKVGKWGSAILLLGLSKILVGALGEIGVQFIHIWSHGEILTSLIVGPFR